MVAVTKKVEHEIWPENYRAWELFCFMQSQWRVAGMGGFLGLDYNVLFKKMDRMQLSRDEYDQLEDDIRAMEFAALPVLNKQPDAP